MEKCVKKGFPAFATAVGISALAATVAASDNYDPLSGEAVLAYAEKTAINEGSGVLTGMGKSLLIYALDSYAPGLSLVFGLSSGDTATQQVIAAIQADGEETRELILAYWDWARAQNTAMIHADYASVEFAIHDWYALPAGSRLTNRDTLPGLVSDCVTVMAKFQSAPHPWDRLDYLHAYALLLNLTIALEAERSELEIVGDAWETSASGMNPTDWWSGLSGDERTSILEAIATTKMTRVSGLLLPGLQVSFADQMSGMDEGTLPGGAYETSDFVRARDLQFSALTFYNQEGGRSKWRYFVGRDPSGNCVHEESYCNAYFIEEGTFNDPNGQRYYVDFDGGSGPYYPDATAAYNEHKALVLKDMIVRGYGPVRAFAENWWDLWGYGPRDRLGVDDELDTYIDNADAGLDGKLALLADYQTKDITLDQRSYLYGFAVAQGLDSVGLISDAAYENPDFLEPRSGNVTPFPWWIHLEAMRAWPLSPEELAHRYRGLPVAKLVSLL
jgi:hypothetical protein